MEAIHARAVEILGDPSKPPNQTELDELNELRSKTTYERKHDLEYPDVTDESLSSKLEAKQEFNQYKQVQNTTTEQTTIDNNVFEPSPSQMIIHNLMIPGKTPYNGLLLYHGTGVGKTCTAVLTANQYIQSNPKSKVIILARPGLHSNFINTINGGKCISEKNNKFQLMGLGQFVNVINSIVLDDTSDNKWVSNQRIWRDFSNTFFIVDEAHNLRVSNDDTSEDKVTPILKSVLKNTSNTKLMLMTATPMFNKASDITELFNLLLTNDNRPTVDANDIFKNNGQEIIENNAVKKSFAQLCQSYVSYMPSIDPYNFPLVMWPQKDGNTQWKKSENLIIVLSTLTKDHLQSYNNINNDGNNENDDTASSLTLLQMANILLPDNRKTLQECISKNPKKDTMYQYNKSSFLDSKNLPHYSPKINQVVKHVLESKGIVMIYSRFVWKGIIPTAMALEHAGMKRYDGVPLIHKSSKNIGSYAVITANDEFTSNINNIVQVARSEENKDGAIIKVLIISDKGAEGIDLRNIRCVHVLEPWYHIGKIEQVLGRASRYESHLLLPEQERNVTLFLHAAKDTVDIRAYDIAETKARGSFKVDEIIQASSMDCLMHLNKLTSSLLLQQSFINKHKHIDYTGKQVQNIHVVNLHKITKPFCTAVSSKSTNTTTYDVYYHAVNTRSIKYALSVYFERHNIVFVSWDELYQYIKSTIKVFTPSDSFDKILTSFIHNKSIVYGPNHIKGTIVVRGDKFTFQPSKSEINFSYMTNTERSIEHENKTIKFYLQSHNHGKISSSVISYTDVTYLLDYLQNSESYSEVLEDMIIDHMDFNTFSKSVLNAIKLNDTKSYIRSGMLWKENDQYIIWHPSSKVVCINKDNKLIDCGDKTWKGSIPLWKNGVIGAVLIGKKQKRGVFKIFDKNQPFKPTISGKGSGLICEQSSQVTNTFINNIVKPYLAKSISNKKDMCNILQLVLRKHYSDQFARLVFAMKHVN